jgi:hypothetical protein
MVTSFQGVHFRINFDPCQVKAKDSAIVEYNRLKTLYRPNLTDILFKKYRGRKIKYRAWLSLPGIDNAQEFNFSAFQQKPKRSYKKKSTTYKKKILKKIKKIIIIRRPRC